MPEQITSEEWTPELGRRLKIPPPPGYYDTWKPGMGIPPPPDYDGPELSVEDRLGMATPEHWTRTTTELEHATAAIGWGDGGPIDYEKASKDRKVQTQVRRSRFLGSLPKLSAQVSPEHFPPGTMYVGEDGKVYEWGGRRGKEVPDQAITREAMRQDEALRAADAEKELRESWFPRTKSMFVQLGADVIGKVQRLFGFGEAADESIHTGQAFAQGVEPFHEESISPLLSRAASGVGRTLPSMIVAGRAAGPYGAIMDAVATEVNNAITEGQDVGLEGMDLHGYVLRAGLIEAIPAIVMQRLGWGGAEKAAGGKGSKEALKAGFKEGMKRAGMTVAEEIPEELFTEWGHSLNTAFSDVDPDAISPEALAETTAQTVAQTVLTVGTVESPNVYTSARIAKARKQRLELLESVRAKGFISAQDAKDLGMLPQDAGSRKSRMGAVNREIADIEEQEYQAWQQRMAQQEAEQQEPQEPPQEPPPEEAPPAPADPTPKPKPPKGPATPAPEEEPPKKKPRLVKPGDYVQWTSDGAEQFTEGPRRVEDVSEDGWIQVEGSKTRFHASEATIFTAEEMAAKAEEDRIRGLKSRQREERDAWRREARRTGGRDAEITTKELQGKVVAAMKLLGIKPTDDMSPEAITKTYLDVLKRERAHPDFGGQDFLLAEELDKRFKAYTQAHDLLLAMPANIQLAQEDWIRRHRPKEPAAEEPPAAKGPAAEEPPADWKPAGGLYDSMFERLQQNKYPEPSTIGRTESGDQIEAEHKRQPFKSADEIREWVNTGKRDEAAPPEKPPPYRPPGLAPPPAEPSTPPEQPPPEQPPPEQPPPKPKRGKKKGPPKPPPTKPSTPPEPGSKRPLGEPGAKAPPEPEDLEVPIAELGDSLAWNRDKYTKEEQQEAADLIGAWDEEENNPSARKNISQRAQDLLDRVKGRKATPPEEPAAKEPEEEPETEPEPEEPKQKHHIPDVQLANEVASRLDDLEDFDRAGLDEMADRVYGGTQAQGTYDPSRQNDAMELGVNLHIARDGGYRYRAQDDKNTGEVKEVIEELGALASEAIPPQTKRSGLKDAAQQFSTPPAYAYAINWIANLQPGEVVLEPSAGTGGIAVHAIKAGAQVYVNELKSVQGKPNLRAQLLEEIGAAGVFTEDAEQIHNILAGKIQPTAIVMNPPFSRAADRMGAKMVQGTDLKHIDAALELLAPGGRLVAIIGAGRDGKTQTLTRWENDLPHNLRADIELARDVYKGYGTTFPTRVLVIDKTAPTGETLHGKAETLEELIDTLEEIRNDRTALPQPQQTRPAGKKPAPKGEGPREPGGPVRPPTGPARPGQSGGTPGRPGKGERPSPGRPRVPTDGPRPEEGPENVPRPGSPKPGDGGTTPTTPGKPPGAGDEVGGKPVRKPREPRPDAEPPTQLDVEAAPKKPRKVKELTDNIYEEYEPRRVHIKDAQPHPASVVESAAMAAVDPPAIDYAPSVPHHIVKSGALSNIQLEAIAYAGYSHGLTIEIEGKEYRRGFMIGDGTGIGKGRTAAGIILDNFRQGRKKAVWVSKNFSLFKDSQEYSDAVGLPSSNLFMHNKAAKSGMDFKRGDGVLFTTYNTLRGKASAKALSAGHTKSRLEQIVDWVGGEDFDGVIVFDESHLMANAIPVKKQRGKTKAAAMARAGLELQEMLPKARVVYMSATAATEVRNLAYAARLGLWGKGTAFPNRMKFIEEITAGGVAAMEKVAADMKALGMYVSRNISFNDGTPKGTVEFERLEHVLTEDETAQYDKMADAWGIVLEHMVDALEETGGAKDGDAVGKSRGAFWGANQRFWDQVITAIQVPETIAAIEKDLEDGHSVVIQLTKTGDAATKNALAEMEEGDTYEDLDISPRRALMDYVERSFPVWQYEEYVDDNGDTRTRRVTDANGNPVKNARAVAMQEQLLDELGSLEVGRRSVLDMFLDHFGTDQVAEVTGRSVRFVKDEKGQLKKDKRSAAKNAVDVDAFMDGKKRILMFSEAGGTGASYHADMSRENQQKRVHYLLQAGWRADVAIQGLGRTHRSNQAQAPIYRLVHTNLKGQKRFLSTIARRLSQLGAITKGERQAATGGGDQALFTAADNLESTEANAALVRFYFDAMAGAIPGIDTDYLVTRLGLNLLDNDGNVRRSLPPITQFLNRVISLPVAAQNTVFSEFMDRLEQEVQGAIARGELDQGVETVRADKIKKLEDRVVYTHEGTGAETRYVKAKLSHKAHPTTWEWLHSGREHGPMYRPQHYVRSKRSGRVIAVAPTGTHEADTNTGRLMRNAQLYSPMNFGYGHVEKMQNETYYDQLTREEAEEAWNQEVAEVPEFVEKDHHYLTGILLPIWNRIKGGSSRVMRMLTDDGEMILGREIPPAALAATLRALGATVSAPKLTPAQAADQIMQQNMEIVLANGWRLQRRRVGGENRIELLGPSYLYHGELEAAGVFWERIQSKTRYFVPTDRAAEVLEEVFEGRPITDVVPRASGPTGAASKPAERAEVEPRPGKAKGQTSALPELRPVPPDVAFRMARELLGEGKAPQVKKMRGAAGRFKGMEGTGPLAILIDPRTAKSEQELAQTLHHEIGHLIDFLPDDTLARGNLLGRLHTLTAFMHGTMPALDKNEQARIRRRAKKEAGKKATKQEVDDIYQRMVKDMGLLANKQVRDELLRLTKWWSGDFEGAKTSYVKYRQSARELYAEALSVFLTSPGELEARAPVFYDALLENLNAKPEVLRAYMELQHILNGTPEELAKIRTEEMRQMFGRSRDYLNSLRAEQVAKRKTSLGAVINYLGQYFIASGQPIFSRMGRKPIKGQEAPDAEAARFALDELHTIDSPNHKFLREIDDQVYQPTIDMMLGRGLNQEQAEREANFTLGEYLYHWRVANERFDIANPGGFTATPSQEQLAAIEERLGADNYEALQEYAKRFHDLVFATAEEAAREGVYNREVFEKVIRPNKGNYAAFRVTRHVEDPDYITTSVIRQVGTFSDIGNPFLDTLLKVVRLNRLIELNRAKNRVRVFLEHNFRDDIKPVPTVFAGEGQPRKPKKSPRRGYEHLVELVDGRPAYFEVPVEIAKSFERHDIGNLYPLAALINSGAYKVFHPLFVTYNPGFVLANPFRDLRRTWVNLGAIEGITLRELLYEWGQAVPAAIRRQKGIDDQVLRDMYENHALDVPYTAISAEVTEDIDRMFVKYGLRGQKAQESRAAKIPIIGPVLRLIENAGAVTETATKVAGWKALEARGVPVQERAYIVRKYVGTPDYKQQGLATTITNSLLMYSRVRWNGLQADLNLATHSDTAAGWWWRQVVNVLLPTSLAKLAAYGGLGAALKAIFGGDDEEEEKGEDKKYKPTLSRVATYFLTDYDPIPLGVNSDGKAVFITIPRDDLGKFIARTWWHLTDLLLVSAGQEIREGDTASDIFSDIFTDVQQELIPSASPPIQFATKIPQYMRGINPVDPHYNQQIVPDKEFSAGGWASHSKVVAWSLDQFGVPGSVIHYAASPVFGETFETGTSGGTETILRTAGAMTGLRRFIRVSNAGMTSDQWARIAHADEERAAFNLSLPVSAQDASTRRYFLMQRQALGDELTAKETAELDELDLFYTAAYLPLREMIRDAEDSGEDPARFRRDMGLAADDPRALLNDPPGSIQEAAESYLQGVVVAGVKPPPKKEDYRTAEAHQEAMDAYEKTRERRERRLRSFVPDVEKAQELLIDAFNAKYPEEGITVKGRKQYWKPSYATLTERIDEFYATR